MPVLQKPFAQWEFLPNYADWWDLIHGAGKEVPAVGGLYLDKSTVIKVQSLLSELKKNAWEGGGPTFDDVAGAARAILDGSDTSSPFYNWTPDDKVLPWAFKYALEGKVKFVVGLTSDERKADEAKLQPNQLALQAARSDMKANVLLAMKAAEFAGAAKDTAQTLKNEIQKLSVILWGKVIEVTPPADLPETQYLDWYKQAIDELTSNVSADPVKVPGEGVGAGEVVVPLVAQYNALVALYKEMEQAMIAAGTEETEQPKLLTLLNKSEQLRDQILILQADVFGMLADLITLTKGDGGVLDFTLIGKGYLDTLLTLINVNVDGIDIFVPPSTEEQGAAEAAAAKFADLLKWAKENLAWVWGVIEASKKFADGIDLEFSDGTQDRIEELKVQIQDEFPQEEKSNLWWLLLAAAAAAASQRKG